MPTKKPARVTNLDLREHILDVRGEVLGLRGDFGDLQRHVNDELEKMNERIDKKIDIDKVLSTVALKTLSNRAFRWSVSAISAGIIAFIVQQHFSGPLIEATLWVLRLLTNV